MSSMHAEFHRLVCVYIIKASLKTCEETVNFISCVLLHAEFHRLVSVYIIRRVKRLLIVFCC